MVTITIGILLVGAGRWASARRAETVRLEAMRRTVLAGDLDPPLMRSTYDLYLDGKQLVYFREPCAPADTEARFLLFLHPPTPETEAPPGVEIEPQRRGFDFEERGRLLNGACVATVELPEGGTSGIAMIETGQWDGTPRSWRAWRRLDRARFRSALDSIASGAAGEPLVRSDFDLYLAGNELLYHRENCAPEEVEPRFFLHLFGHDRVGSGARRLFENRDFDFARHGVLLDGACLAVFRLPEGVASVRTGQWSPEQAGHWSEVVRVDFAPFRTEIEEIVSGRAGPPAARGVFDLYREGAELRWFRDDCRPEDREVPFFLDLHAADAEALPEHRRADGFEDLHFAFSHYGVVLDGRCLVRVTVPDYEMRRLHTGQSFPGGEPVWEVEISPGR